VAVIDISLDTGPLIKRIFFEDILFRLRKKKKKITKFMPSPSLRRLGLNLLPNSFFRAPLFELPQSTFIRQPSVSLRPRIHKMKRPNRPTAEASAKGATTGTLEPDASQQQQQAQVDSVASLRAAQVASLRGTLRTVSAAEDSALESQAALARQGEALDRIDGKLDQADRSLTVSKVYMRTIGSWAGWIANAITGAEEKAADKAAAKGDARSSEGRVAKDAAPAPAAAPVKSSLFGGLFKGSKDAPSAPREQRGGGAQSARSAGDATATTRPTTATSGDEESDALLDALESNVLRLQAHAVRQGDVVREQNTRLEALDTKMGSVQDKTRKLTRDIHKAL
jgi:hypothetical protein